VPLIHTQPLFRAQLQRFEAGGFERGGGRHLVIAKEYVTFTDHGGG